jgi:predicted metal-dependent phosphoesterase TrpH
LNARQEQKGGENIAHWTKDGKQFEPQEMAEEFSPEEIVLIQRFQELRQEYPCIPLGVDVHSHSLFSDGTMGLRELGRRAAMAGFIRLFVTDHNAFGLDLRQEDQCRMVQGLYDDYGIALCSGMEVDCLDNLKAYGSFQDCEVHIGALFADPESGKMQKMVAEQQERREGRNEKMIPRIRSRGFMVPSLDELHDLYPTIVTMGHIARHVTDSSGRKVNAEKFLTGHMLRGGDCYVPKELISVEEAVGIVRETDAIAVFNHPYATLGQGTFRRHFETIMDRYVGFGVQAVEGYTRKIPPAESWRIVRYGEENDVTVLGGSDTHKKGDRIAYIRNVLDIFAWAEKNREIRA